METGKHNLSMINGQALAGEVLSKGVDAINNSGSIPPDIKKILVAIMAFLAFLGTDRIVALYRLPDISKDVTETKIIVARIAKKMGVDATLPPSIDATIE